MRLSARSEKGRTRAVNQDSFIVEDMRSGRGLLLAAVADGMGGHLAGEVASALAVSVLRQHFLETSEAGSIGESLFKSMQDGFSLANGAIVESSQGSGRYGMGTTLTAAVIFEDRLCIGHIGDSRAYLITKGKVEVMTDDHSIVGELVRKGDLSPEEAMRHPQRNVITRALGIDISIKADVIERNLCDADGLLICSDGITGLLTAQDIEALLAEHSDPDVITSELIALAYNRGGYDDATCVLCFFDAKGGVMA